MGWPGAGSEGQAAFGQGMRSDGVGGEAHQTARTGVDEHAEVTQGPSGRSGKGIRLALCRPVLCPGKPEPIAKSPARGPTSTKWGLRGPSPHHLLPMQPLPVLPKPSLASSVPFLLGCLVGSFPNTGLTMSFAAENVVLPLPTGYPTPHHGP